MEGMDNLLDEFVIESHENLDRLDLEVVSLEENPDNRTVLDSIFRAIHTIKGSAPFLGLKRLERITHVGENLLSKLREGQINARPEIITVLLRLLDTVRRLLYTVQQTGSDDGVDFDELEGTLTELASGGRTADRTIAPHDAVSPGTVGQPAAPPRASGSQTAVPPATGASSVLAAPAPSAPAQSAAGASASSSSPPPNAARAEVRSADPARRSAEAPAAPAQGASSQASPPPAGASSSPESVVRVDVNLLDRLMNLVGELVLARNQLLQLTGDMEDQLFTNTSQRINLITSELQEGVMKTRMQPIATLWSKFPRLVRDIAHSCAKQVQLELEGRETELDRTIVDALKDPLTHIVRNSIDHGIEAPEVRRTRGKTAMGHLALRAFHEGGKVVIVVADDGAGIDPERIKQKAIQRGLINQEQAWRMTAQELINLIFTPGFSTADQVSHLSGRGVGMDVVKTNLERIGGTVEVRSVVGEGTTLHIRIPLTLAIIPALMVNCDKERYAIPQVNLLELVQLSTEAERPNIERILGVPVYRLRGNLLPLVWLKTVLEFAADIGTPAAPSTAETEAQHIIVLQVEQQQFGLVVDEVDDMQEIVVKPLHKALKTSHAFAGATILGDGHVALILDVMGLAEVAGLINAARERAFQERLERERHAVSQSQSLLLFEVNHHGRMVLPLAQVTRLEEFQQSTLEHVGGEELVQYRNSILPLIRLATVLPERRKIPREQVDQASTIHVIVYSTGQDSSVGFVVDEIHDIVESSLERMHPGSRQGVQGNVVIQGKVTQVLDLPQLLRMASAHAASSSSFGRD